MRRIIPLALSLMLLAMVLPGAVSAAKPATGTGITTPVTGTLANGGAFTGALNLTQFAVQNGQIAALGTLTGTLTDAAGAVLGTVNQAVTLPVTAAAGTCSILHLELGPLDLNLLGLMVHLDKVVLDISAQSAPGNLLGNLLCAVSHLLDSNGLPGLSNLLNRILGILGGLTL